MSLSAGTLFVAAAAYLLLLFLIAYASERSAARRWASHPLIYTLSLGVYATTWSYYGSVGFAAEQGALFLTIYLGVALAFALGPVLLRPLLRLTRTHQLTSAADLFAFRFNSQLAGVLVTVMMLAGSLPYFALQIRAVAEATQVLSPATSPRPVALVFCLLISVFAIVFGARHVTPREKHAGLVMAMAFESLLKLLALLLVAAVAIAMAFGGLGGLDAWLAAHPERLEAFYRRAYEGPWNSLLLLTFAAAFLLPRQFHMIFTENLDPRGLRGAGWGLPLYLLLLSLAVPPILWAGQALLPDQAPDYYVLGLAQASGSLPLTLLAYLGGISAASAMIIVATLSLSSMSLNHLLLPFLRPRPELDLYRSLRWARRAVIAGLIAAGYGFYELLQHSAGLVAWGLISFLAMAQFLPGIAGVLFWPRATRQGFVAGLLAGATVWALGGLWPALAGGSMLARWGLEGYEAVTFLSLSLNTLLFVGVSLLTRAGARERRAAAACREGVAGVSGGAPQAESARQFVAELMPVTGGRAARTEVEKALGDLGLDWDERRPEKLQLLREQIERNLSGMMGPVLARMIVDSRLALDTEARSALAQNVRLIEERLESSRSRFVGVAAELDQLRRYHRQILEDLPLGVVAVTDSGRIVRWNPAMTGLSGITAGSALGTVVTALPAPWDGFLGEFLAAADDHAHKRVLAREGETRWLNLHKAAIGDPNGSGRDRLVLVEDVTEVELLERELAHSERLASIGRLAAGVAHEIGNPVTGIACLAQDLKLEHDETALHEGLAQILEQTRRISTIVQTLVSYAHSGSREEARREPVRLHRVVEEAREVVQLSKRARSLRFDNRLGQALCVDGDPQRLTQVFVNLFANAADACGEGGEVRVSARRQRGMVYVSVADNGPGIPKALRERVLEPFFTTKPAGQGTGLGLSLVDNIVKEHSGQLRIDSGEQGTRIVFSLPEHKE